MSFPPVYAISPSFPLVYATPPSFPLVYATSISFPLVYVISPSFPLVYVFTWRRPPRVPKWMEEFIYFRQQQEGQAVAISAKKASPSVANFRSASKASWRRRASVQRGAKSLQFTWHSSPCASGCWSLLFSCSVRVGFCFW
eukprot:GHVT01082290.1.p2 GENE.GHVT01082290.1~~GHVT01082290.1.p2  ORF type:complete len:141 (+),score=23.80 GHVT01082290.1:391-813(+)